MATKKEWAPEGYFVGGNNSPIGSIFERDGKKYIVVVESKSNPGYYAAYEIITENALYLEIQAEGSVLESNSKMKN